MRISTTFIPNDCVRGLLGAIWNEYKYGGGTRELLIDLRAELGKAEFALFEKEYGWADGAYPCQARSVLNCARSHLA